MSQNYLSEVWGIWIKFHESGSRIHSQFIKFIIWSCTIDKDFKLTFECFVRLCVNFCVILRPWRPTCITVHFPCSIWNLVLEFKIFVCNFEMHCVHEVPLSSDNRICTLSNQIQHRQATGKLFKKACFVVICGVLTFIILTDVVTEVKKQR